MFELQLSTDRLPETIGFFYTIKDFWDYVRERMDYDFPDNPINTFSSYGKLEADYKDVMDCSPETAHIYKSVLDNTRSMDFPVTIATSFPNYKTVKLEILERPGLESRSDYMWKTVFAGKSVRLIKIEE